MNSCPYLVTAGLFLHGISLYAAILCTGSIMCIYCKHIQTQGVRETMCTLHAYGISNVVEATWEHRFINSDPGTQGVAMHDQLIMVCLIVLLEYLHDWIN